MALPLIAALPAIASGIGAVGSWISGRKNRKSQERTNDRAERFSREMFDKQNQRDIDFWNMQNAYNDPSAQMQRLKDAGLNPHLAYGSGHSTEAGAIATHSAQQPNLTAPKYEDSGVIGESMFNYLQIKQAQANIARTQADTDNIQSQTIGRNFDNALRQSIGLEAFADDQTTQFEMRKWDNDLKQLGYGKQLAEFNAWVAGAFDGRPTDDRNSPIAKAIRAGYDQTQVDLGNARKLGDLRAAEIALKRFEVGLTKEGISPNSPWYIKIVGQLVSNLGLHRLIL